MTRPIALPGTRAAGAARRTPLVTLLIVAVLAVLVVLSVLAVLTWLLVECGVSGAAWASPSPTGSPSATPTSAPTSATVSSAAAGQVSWGAAPANDTIGKNRPHFDYTLSSGARITDALEVANFSRTTITLKVYASDGFTTSTGALDLLPANKKPVDVGAWITVAKSTVTLKPQQTVTVPFTLTVPANATPGDHTGGVVASLVTKGGSGSVNLDRRLGSRVYLRVPGTLNPILHVGEVHVTYHGTIKPGGSGSTTVNYTVANTGNMRLAAHQSIKVADLLGLLSHTAKVADLPELLPGDSLTRTVTVRGVWPGFHLSASVRLQPVAGQDDPAVTVAPVTGTATTWGWPWGQLLVLLAIIAAALAWWWLQRRHKAKVAAAIDAAVSHALDKTEASPNTKAAPSVNGTANAPAVAEPGTRPSSGSSDAPG